jgi:putative N6-adenine-specific DNA methylase
VLLRGSEDRFTVSVDSSGELLHRRGWRIETGRAPLRETLAAGMLLLGGYDPERPFVDPMCGSGTIVLEACALALGLAPGLARSFAFERWPAFEPSAWDRLRDEALRAIRDAPRAPLFGFDRDEAAVELARRNAGRAGLLPHLVLEPGAFGARRPPAGPGFVALNPPYGRRLPGAQPLREMGRVLRAEWPGWRVALLSPDPAAERALGVRPAATHPLRNGGLRVRLVVADLPRAAPSHRTAFAPS